MTAAIGRTPSFDFTGDDLSDFIQRIMQAQQAAGGLNPTSPGAATFRAGPIPNANPDDANSGIVQAPFDPADGPGLVRSVRGAGEVDPTGRGTGSIDQRRPPAFAGNENDVQRLERQQAGPADLAALGAPQGSPDQLLFNRAGMGGGLNPFVGQADPLGARNVPLPPGRPDASALMMPVSSASGAVSGMNPGFRPGSNQPDGNTLPLSSKPTVGALVRSGEYDPLTRQPISPQPQASAGAPALGNPMQRFMEGTGLARIAGVSQLAPQAAPGQPGQPAPQVPGAPGSGDVMGQFFGRSGLGGILDANPNLLTSIGSALLTQRGVGRALGVGLQANEEANQRQAVTDLARFKVGQQIAGQSATYDHLVNNLKLDPTTARAAMLNPNLLSSILTQQNKDAQKVEIDGKYYWLKPGEKPGAGNLIGDVTDKDPVHFDRDPTTGELTAFRTNQLFPDKAAGVGGTANASPGGQGTPTGGDGPASRVLIPGNRGVRVYGSTDPATGQPVQPPPNSPPGVSGFYDASGKPTTLASSPETERDKAVGGAIGKDIAGYIEAGKPAREKMAALNVLEDAWKAGKDKITTGPTANRVLGLKQFARGSLGLDIGDNIAPSELIAKIGTQLATADAKSLTARPTQFDFSTYLRNNPGLALSPEGNAALIGIKKQQAQHEIDLASLARDRNNWDRWDEITSSYDKAHPIISPLTKRPLGADEVNFPDPSAGQGPQAGGAAGRFQQLVGSGMSKADAYAQMHREGM